MSSPALDFAMHLQGLGLGTFAGSITWSINVGTEPPTPDGTITLYDLAGSEPDTDEMSILRPQFQVRVREPGYAAAYAKAEAIRAALLVPPPIVASGTTYFGVFVSSDLASLGRDDNDRYLIVATYRAMRQTD